MHLSVLLSLIPLPLPLGFRLMLSALIAISGIASLRRHALRVDDTSIYELLLKANGTVEALLVNGTRFEAGISRHSTVLPWLIIMLLEREGARHVQSLLILPDVLPPEDLRILRAWLRWKLI
jgi:hypothetical protein